MIVLASKHYVAKDHSGRLYSKGVSYVRRTGSVVQNMAAKAFTEVVLSTTLLKEAIRGLKFQYNRIIVQIRSGKHLDLYKIRATRNAITTNFVKIISSGPRESASTYAQFEGYSDEELDFEHL
jgi:hypothetical protein